MANTLLLGFLSLTIINVSFLPFFTHAISSCNSPCRTLNDCTRQLIFVNVKCNDGPNVGTHQCSHESPPPTSDCQSTGTLTCKGKSYPQYNCPPSVTPSTHALLTLNYFSKGGGGGRPSKCDEKYHDDNFPIIALSTGWYQDGSHCVKMIRITANNGKSVRAMVVDECNIVNGCDAEHAFQPACRNYTIDGRAPFGMPWD